jgi:hypothetical protein
MSEFRRGNQRSDYGDRNKRPNRGGYEKREYPSKPTVSMVDKFIEEIESIIANVNSQTDNMIEHSINKSKEEFGQISFRIDYVIDGVVKRAVNVYFMENRKSKAGEYYNAFTMVTHGSNGAVLFSTFGKADAIIAKLIPYADTIISRNAGLDTEAKASE